MHDSREPGCIEVEMERGGMNDLRLLLGIWKVRKKEELDYQDLLLSTQMFTESKIITGSTTRLKQNSHARISSLPEHIPLLKQEKQYHPISPQQSQTHICPSEKQYTHAPKAKKCSKTKHPHYLQT